MRGSTIAITALVISCMLVVGAIFFPTFPLTSVDHGLPGGSHKIDPLDFNASPSPDYTHLASPDGFGPMAAKVDNLPLYQLEMLPYLSEVMPADQYQALKTFDDVSTGYLTRATQTMAVDVLLEQRAIEKGLDREPQIQAVIRQYARRYLRAAYLASITPGLVSDDEVRAAYEKLSETVKNQQQYHARHILLATEKEAWAVHKALLQNQKPFAELARTFSLDKASSLNGGDLGLHTEGQLNPQFEAVILKLPLNQYSQPFKTDVGWHIAIVDERRPAEAAPFEQAEAVIRNNLEQQAVNKYVQDMLEKASIQIFALDALVPAEPASEKPPADR